MTFQSEREGNVLEGLEVIRYGSRRVIIFIKNLIWFLWQLVKLSFLLICYKFVKDVELHQAIDIQKKQWLENTLLSFNLILAGAIGLVLVVAVNEYVLRKCGARRRTIEIVPCLLLILSPLIFGYITYTMWFYLADAIEINEDMSANEIWQKPESDFIDLMYKITIILTLIVYLASNVFWGLFCIVSWTIGVNAVRNIRQGNPTLLANAGRRRRFDESESSDDVDLVMRQYHIRNRKDYL